ncbi:thioesterase II family protein [Chryseobacterium gregarium]|uniref:thioesterase II family protein n=1 Tax=Chryseobacterium gregarium TaxID=456299 RepID=UPI0005521B97|nr:thioesterase domain-containing protein [Chryseobacterium gregarium]
MNKQLFLLHFAGGNKYSYNFLQKTITSDIEFIPIELPGRGERFKESLITDKKEAIEDLFKKIKKKRNDSPFIIFGHSMGALLGLSVTRMLEEQNDIPEFLIVSGNPGPLENYKIPIRYNLDDSSFKEKISEMGGIPVEILENKDAFAFFAKIMRADFECIEKGQDYEKDVIIKAPIYAMMGSEESLNTKIKNWKRFTNSHFYHSILKGNHFFIHENSKEIGKLINYCFKIKESNYVKN